MAYMQTFDQFKNAACGGFIQIACWFVGQQEARVVDQRAGQRHTLLFAAGKFAGTMIGAIFKANFFEPVSGNCQCVSLPPQRRSVPAGFLFAARQERHSYVFKRRKFRQKVMELPNVTNLPIAKSS